MTPSLSKWSRLALLVALLFMGSARGAFPVEETAQPGEEGTGPAGAAATESTFRGPDATHVPAPARVAMVDGAGHVLIDVKLNGRGPYRMILDTGAATTVIDAEVGGALGAALGMTPDGIAEVRMVMPGSPAEAAGLRAGDMLIRVDGKPVTNAAMMAALAGTSPIVLGVRRDEEELDLVIFGDAPPKG